jgi:ribosomal silencing factor RsfS
MYRLRDLAVYSVSTENMYLDYIIAVTCVSARQMHAMANEVLALVY